ncbi:Chemoreceptor glutamine deamidase CheD (plasmid) [Asticcacaulis sp. MM231]|uniref:chemoreceptor glutamine deamidase CheD n=1 Tax=Asticcacaulis sp. MM231 TaxID=3157666 RepID=UPI0032D5A004
MARAIENSTVTGHEQHLARTRIKDVRLGEHNVRVQPGEYFVTDTPGTVIITILGSCVAACIRNPKNGFGGMNHFMLPESESGQWGGVSSQMRYGNHAMENLINEVLKSGCLRHDLEIKLFGGANMYAGHNEVGTQNARFAQAYLKAEGLRVLATDLGGNHGRRIHYSPQTGRVKRLLLNDSQDKSVTRTESSYSTRLVAKPIEGDIELFG